MPKLGVPIHAENLHEFFSNTNQKLLNSFFCEIEASYHQLDCQCQSMPWRLEVMRFFIQFPFVGKPLLLSKAIMIELLKTRKLLMIGQTSFYRTSKRLEHNFSKLYIYVLYIWWNVDLTYHYFHFVLKFMNVNRKSELEKILT